MHIMQSWLKVDHKTAQQEGLVLQVPNKHASTNLLEAIHAECF